AGRSAAAAVARPARARGRCARSRAARQVAAGRRGFPRLPPFPRHWCPGHDRGHAPGPAPLSMRRPILPRPGAGVCAAAAGGAEPKLDNLGAWGLALARPLTMPFLWRSLADALHGGDPAEAFARAQVLLDALPEWADGHAVFAWRYALEGGDPLATGEVRAQAAKAR